MDKQTYIDIENFMHTYMEDSAHDESHIYRVLYAALQIAQAEHAQIDTDVLLAACLLHDIGRPMQHKNPELCHAQEGSKLAYAFLRNYGWQEQKAAHVRDCIATHRFRGNNIPQSMEAKILFDADKLDAAGALGIARTLVFEGLIGEPLYTLDEKNQVMDGTLTSETSFFQEYQYKLKKIYGQFYTKAGKALAEQRKKTATDFYEGLLSEVQTLYAQGEALLQESIQ